MRKNGFSQVAFLMPEELHKLTKIKAIEANVALKDWIMTAIIEKIKREE